MASVELKSTQFRKEREANWRELERLIKKAGKRGVGSLEADELTQLPILYNGALSSLSVARSVSLDRGLLNYLENLATRGYFCVYAARGSTLGTVWRFFTTDLPEAVRQARWMVLLAAGMMFLGFLTGYILVQQSPDWYFSFMPDHLASGRTPLSATEDLRDVLYNFDNSKKAWLSVFASYLFAHNATVGILAFSLGFAFGIPVIVILFVNGTMLGSFVALYESRGLGPDIWAWLSIHGSTELLAIVLCAAAGLVIGRAVAFPGRKTRLQSLSRNGASAARIVVGALIMFLIAGLLEGFARQLVSDIHLRFAIGAAMLALWAVYFTLSGRRTSDGQGD